MRTQPRRALLLALSVQLVHRVFVDILVQTSMGGIQYVATKGQVFIVVTTVVGILLRIGARRLSGQR